MLGIMRNPPSKFLLTIILPIMVLAMVSFLEGCDQSSNKYINELKNYKQPPDTDITSSPEYNFLSFAGTVWKTKVKTALADGTEYTGAHHLYLLAPKDFDPTQPDYMAGHDTKITSVLPAGVELRIGQLMHDNGIGNILYVTGTLEEGTNAPKTVYLDFALLANNHFINGWPSTNWDANPDMLAPYGDSSQSASSVQEIRDTPQAGYEKGYANGKASAISAKDVLPHNRLAAIKGLSDPWLGLDSRPMAAMIYGEDYVAAYESGYRKGFHDYFEDK